MNKLKEDIMIITKNDDNTIKVYDIFYNLIEDYEKKQPD